MNLQLSLKNINYNTKQLLTVKELLKEVNYDYNELYIDKFYENIEQDKWIYIDENMLKWVGYSDTDINSSKRAYLLIIKDNFIKNKDYILYNNKEFNEKAKCMIMHLGDNTINKHNKTKHLILSPDCFKLSLMLLKTKKSKEIREYYIELEKIFKFYLQYQNEYKDKAIKQKDEKLDKLIEEKINNDIHLLEKTGYIYIATNLQNSYKNINKIGKTDEPPKRLGNYNTAHTKNDEFYYTYIMKCYKPYILENIIHSLLEPFQDKEKKELFQLHYTPLNNIIKTICKSYNMLTDMVNNYIKNNYINDLELQPIIPEEFDYYNMKQAEYDINVDIIELEKNIIEYKGLKLYLCPRCNNYLTKDKTIMLSHINRVYKCKEQDKQILNTNIIENLIKENNVQLYPCTKCNRSVFKTEYHLKRHLNSLIPCDTEFKCNLCNQYFRTKDELNSHNNQQYCIDKEGNILYEKKQESINNINTNNNIIISDGMTFYKCHLCNTLFKTKQNLKSHQNKKVKCNELHYCNKCGKYFHTIDNLTKHQKIINCDKLCFKCTICNNTFSSNKGLKRHNKNVNCSKNL